MFMAFIKHNNLPVSMLRFPSYLPKRASDGTKIMVATVLQQQLHLGYSSKQKPLIELNLVACLLAFVATSCHTILQLLTCAISITGFHGNCKILQERKQLVCVTGE